MQIPVYLVDAFTNKIFSGNPAAVCVLPKWLPDEVLHKIAKENNQPATAFLVRDEDKFNIRWITPEYELPICGHGTLAAGFVIFNYLEPTWQKVDLKSRSELLPVVLNDNFIALDFPAKSIEEVSLPLLEKGLDVPVKEIYQHAEERCFAVLESEEEVRQVKPNMEILKKLAYQGITVTATGREVDFVSRTFYPKKIFSEDAATGASHCLLVPYWSKKLDIQSLHALQLSARGGELFCRNENDRVLIKGKAVLYMQGTITIG